MANDLFKNLFILKDKKNNIRNRMFFEMEC